MRELRLTVGDYASPGGGDAPNPCVMGCAHLFLGSLFVFGEGGCGSEGGRVESRLAVSAVLANFRGSTISEPRQRLREALEHASQVLYARSQSAAAFHDAWARCTAVLVRRRRLYAARVGDLQIYLVRGSQIDPVFERPVGDGAADLLGRGGEPTVEVREDDIDLRPGDRLVLANSALLRAVPLEEVGRIVASLVPAVAARRLVEAVDRAGEGRPVSVQVVQAGDAPATEEVPVLRPPPSAPASRSIAAPPLPPMLSDPAPLDVDVQPDRIPVRPMPSTPRMALEYASRRQTRPTWQWFAGLAAVGVVALILSQAFTGSETVATPKVISASPAAQPAPAGVLADGQTFWDHVSSRLAEGQGHLAPGEVRRWLSSPAEAGMRLAEARAVIAALEAPDPAETVEDPLAVETEPASEQELGEIEPTAEGEPAELPSEEPVAEVRPAEQPAAAAPEEELAAAPADASWNPASLPAGLRVFERIFGMDDKREAAERLRNYIHAHHRNVDPVFTRLDAYVAQAPKQRTLSVLKQMRYAQPGPKTRRWTRDTVRKLASAAQ